MVCKMAQITRLKGDYMANPEYRHLGTILVTSETSLGAAYNFNPANHTGYDAVLTYIQAADQMSASLLETVESNGLLGWTHKRALMGPCFQLAESWVSSGRMDRAIQAWNHGCYQRKVSRQLRIMGVSIFHAVRLGREDAGSCSRLGNKWKAWVRFRQDPTLVKAASEISSGHFEWP